MSTHYPVAHFTMSYSNPSLLLDHTLLRIYNDLGSHAFLRDKKLWFKENATEFVSFNTEVLKRRLEVNFDGFKYLKPDDPDPIFHDSSMVRYGKREHLKLLFDGKLRFTNAKSYKDDANLARDDNETTISKSDNSLPSTVKIGNEEYKVVDFERHYDLIINEKGNRGFFVICCSDVEHPKLQRRFECDSYVIIKDRVEFAKMACAAFEKKVGQKCLHGLRGVKYYSHFDTPPLASIEDYFLKKRPKHAWQREIRIYVDHDQDEIKPIDVEVKFPDGLISEIKSFA
jgi:hypothetical protein